MKLTIAELEHGMETIRDIYGERTKECSGKNMMSEIKHMEEELISIGKEFEKLKQVVNVNFITNCIQQFISAELDYETPGIRGLGRLSTSIPRFGAYFRKHLSELSLEDIGKMYALIQNVIVMGYLFHALFIEKEVQNPKITSTEQLYENWIPYIYSSGRSSMTERARNALFNFSAPAYKELKEFMSRCNFKGGGFLVRDKTNDIILYYAIGGFMLRRSEVT